VTSRLGLTVPAVAALILLLFVVGYLLERRVTAVFRAQTFIAGQGMTEIERRYGSVLWIGQLAFIGIIFAVGLYVGGVFFTFYAGGLITVMLLYTAHSIRSLLYYRALAKPGSVSGSISMSSSMLIRIRAHQCFEGALVCFVAGLALPHAALLGGAFLLGAGGVGYLRRANQAQARL
jgi:hypothetical protein